MNRGVLANDLEGVALCGVEDRFESRFLRRLREAIAAVRAA
jgi:hypothetical protein